MFTATKLLDGVRGHAPSTTRTMTAVSILNMAPIKKRQKLTQRNLHMLNHLVDQGRHPQSIFTPTASWERSSWSTDRLPLDRRMDLVKARVSRCVRQLQIRPKGPEILHKYRIRLRGHRVLISDSPNTQLQSHSFWKRLAYDLHHKIDSLVGSGPSELSRATTSNSTGIIPTNYDRIRGLQSKETVANWVLSGMHP